MDIFYPFGKKTISGPEKQMDNPACLNFPVKIYMKDMTDTISTGQQTYTTLCSDLF